MTIPQSAGLPAALVTLTKIASKLLPGENEPICLSKSHTAAPPRVARYRSVATVSGLLVNVSGEEAVAWPWCWKAQTLEAILAFWIALSMDILNPPETSVPRPTWV